MDAFEWAHNATDKLSTEFGSRLVFVGIQGSRARGEARDGSDIDLVVLLDHVDADDLARYHSVIQAMPHSELACGFVGPRGCLQLGRATSSSSSITTRRRYSARCQT